MFIKDYSRCADNRRSHNMNSMKECNCETIHCILFGRCRNINCFCIISRGIKASLASPQLSILFFSRGQIDKFNCQEKTRIYSTIHTHPSLITDMFLVMKGCKSCLNQAFISPVAHGEFECGLCTHNVQMPVCILTGVCE